MESRLMVVCVEGLERSCAEVMFELGGLPALRALVRDGMAGPLLGHVVPYEPAGIVSSLTGAAPGEHGVFSFWRTHARTFAATPELATSAEREAPFPGEHGRLGPVALVNVFGTHPVVSADGYVISYPTSLSIRTTHPPSLLGELHRAGIRYRHDLARIFAGEPAGEFLDAVIDIERGRVDAARHLWGKGVRVMVVVLTLIERVSHFFWPRDLEASLADPRAPLRVAYETADRAVHDLVSLLGPSDRCLLFSEIGFGPLRRFVPVDAQLERHGLLRRDGERVDASHSLAREAPQGTHGVNLNLRRRYPDGCIDDRDEEAVLREVRDVLAELRVPETGAPLCQRIVPGRELYPGVHANRAPDLVLLPHDERYLPLGNPAIATSVHRTLQTGWHRRGGFWAAHGEPLPMLRPGDVATPETIGRVVAALTSAPTLTASG